MLFYPSSQNLKSHPGSLPRPQREIWSLKLPPFSPREKKHNGPAVYRWTTHRQPCHIGVKIKADLGLYNDSFLPQMTGRCGLNLLWLALQDACIPRGPHMAWSNATLLCGDFHEDLVTKLLQKVRFINRALVQKGHNWYCFNNMTSLHIHGSVLKSLTHILLTLNCFFTN